jgi:glycosyltransferase involved in cell wall biosynthesis
MFGVSYLLTVYNKAPYLEGVVAGLAGQTGDFPREFIFVDDGSSDGSPELVEKLTAGWPNVTLIRQANRGPSAALNAAAAAARYDYFKAVDADDILVPDSTQWLLDALRRHDAVFAYGDGGSYDLGQPVQMPVLADTPVSEALDDPMTLLLRNSFISPSYMMVPAAQYRAVGGCVEYIIPQDYSLQLKLAPRGRFAYVPGPIALMPRVAPGRLSDAPARTLHDINLLLFETLRDAPGLTPEQRRLAARRASGRALRFRRRYPGPSPLWRSWLRYLQARLPFAFDEAALIAAGLKDFGVPSQLDGFHPYPGCLTPAAGRQ